MKDYKMRGKSGQILVVVLLVVVVSLAIGLSVASRNLTNLKGSTQAEQSQRAFTAAEGGVENTLSQLNKVAQDISTFGSGSPTSGSGCTINTSQATCGLGNTPSGIDANTNPILSKSNVVVKANSAYERVVDTGDVAQVNLQGMFINNTFTVRWSKKSNTNETNPKASLEFTFVCGTSGTNCITATDTKTAGAYGQHREAITIDPNGSNQSGFLACGNDSLPFVDTDSTEANSDFNCKVTFALPAAPNPPNAMILRIKPFWRGTTINVSGANLPVQTYDITSTATTDSGLSRKVQVSRDALPQLPAIFDYVLYSGGDIIK